MKKKAAAPFDLALQYLSYRSRTEAEIRTYLDKKGLDSGSAEEVIQKLSYYGYIDDMQYVRSAVQNNGCGHRYGRMRLRNELKQRGISEALLSNLDEIFTEAMEADCLAFQFEKACRKVESEPIIKQKQKINAALQRKGFSYGEIAALINAYDFEEAQTEDAADAMFEDLKRCCGKYHRLHSRKGLTGRELDLRIMRSLLAKGYAYDDVKSVMSDVADISDQ